MTTGKSAADDEKRIADMKARANQLWAELDLGSKCITREEFAEEFSSDWFYLVTPTKPGEFDAVMTDWLARFEKR